MVQQPCHDDFPYFYPSLVTDLTSTLAVMNSDNDGLSLSQDLSTPLFTSRPDDAAQSLQGLTETDEIDVLDEGGRCEVHPREHQGIDDKVSALSLAMIIFYNVTGKYSQ